MMIIFTVEIFVDFQKAFDSVHHQILLATMGQYVIRGGSYNWFESYFSNRIQYVSNDYDYRLATINCCVPEGFVLGPLLLLLYINGLYQTTNFCKIYYFTDDADFFCPYNCIKKLNRLVNADLHVDSLNANKISFNIKKTEMVIFEFEQKEFEGHLKIKLCGKRLYSTESIKYVGISKLMQTLVGNAMLIIFP